MQECIFIICWIFIGLFQFNSIKFWINFDAGVQERFIN